MDEMKKTEDTLTEIDGSIKDVNRFKYEREKAGGWLTTFKKWQEHEAMIE